MIHNDNFISLSNGFEINDINELYIIRVYNIIVVKRVSITLSGQ